MHRIIAGLNPSSLWMQARSFFDCRIGITARLGISFATVAAFAAAANLIAEQAVSIIQTTRVESVATPAAPPLTVPEPTPPAPTPAVPPPLVSTGPLTLAADSYQRALEVRTRAANPENDANVLKAEQELSAAIGRYNRQVQQRPRTSLRELNAVLKNYQENGAALLTVVEKRETTSREYIAHLDSMNARIKQSIDGAWKILGRIVARQSLLELRDAHEEIRRQFLALGASPTMESSAIAALLRSEETFSRTLKANERSLSRSEGAGWVSFMMEELAQIEILRQTFLEDSRNVGTAERRFAESHAAFRRVLRSLGEHIEVAAQPKRIPTASAVIQAPVPVPADPDLGSASKTATLVSERPDDTSKRTLVAWLSGSVVAFVLLISVATVRSIVVPIRRLLKATAQLTKGDVYVPVARGGIKELDTLTLSFNQMADELAAHRNTIEKNQQELERRVVDRTRQLQELAECDPLTGLPNRRHLLVLLKDAIRNARLHDHLVGVFFLDLDNFKNINDSMGHGFGDRVLVAIAYRLKEITLDFGFAARLGGDEFTIVFTGGRNIEDVRNAGLRIIAAFQEPISLDNRDLVISVSAGASIFPDHEKTSEGLLRAADAALFRAKALGRSQLSVFTPELLAAAAAKFTTEQGLRRAVERGEFELVFQPEISSETLQTALVEALIRWRLPDGRLAPPSEFLAVAEESGLIVELSDWVIRSAIQTAAQWHHGEWPTAKVAINVSPRQLLDHYFVEKVQRLLEEFKLPAQCIEMELTESVLQTGPSTIDTLHRLRACGIAIALDDFGTGYSSLASLEQLPFSRIKLDRSLIAGIDTNVRSAAITRAIIGLCHGLGLEVTAEGVERPEQFAILIAHRPMYLQGYLFSKPVTVNEVVPAMTRITQEIPLLLLTATKPESTQANLKSKTKARSA